VFYSCSVGLEFLDLARLVAGQHTGEYNVDPEVLRRALIVAGEHGDVDAASAQCSRRFNRPR
jgi:hypothetical protein